MGPTATPNASQRSLGPALAFRFERSTLPLPAAPLRLSSIRAQAYARGELKGVKASQTRGIPTGNQKGTNPSERSRRCLSGRVFIGFSSATGECGPSFSLSFWLLSLDVVVVPVVDNVGRQFSPHDRPWARSSPAICIQFGTP